MGRAARGGPAGDLDGWFRLVGCDDDDTPFSNFEMGERENSAAAVALAVDRADLLRCASSLMSCERVHLPACRPVWLSRGAEKVSGGLFCLLLGHGKWSGHWLVGPLCDNIFKKKSCVKLQSSVFALTDLKSLSTSDETQVVLFLFS